MVYDNNTKCILSVVIIYFIHYEMYIVTSIKLAGTCHDTAGDK